MTDVSRSLTIDAGQTGIRALLRSADGRHDTFDFAGIRTDRALMPQLADVVKAVAATAQGTERTSLNFDKERFETGCPFRGLPSVGSPVHVAECGDRAGAKQLFAIPVSTGWRPEHIR